MLKRLPSKVDKRVSWYRKDIFLNFWCNPLWKVFAPNHLVNLMLQGDTRGGRQCCVTRWGSSTRTPPTSTSNSMDWACVHGHTLLSTTKLPEISAEQRKVRWGSLSHSLCIFDLHDINWTFCVLTSYQARVIELSFPSILECTLAFDAQNSLSVVAFSGQGGTTYDWRLRCLGNVIHSVLFGGRKEDFAVGRLWLSWLVNLLVGKEGLCPFLVETRKETLVNRDGWRKGKEMSLAQA